MFNRQPFNRSVQEGLSSNGLALMKMGATAILNKDIYAKSDNSNLRLQGNLALTKNIFVSSIASAKINGTINATKVFIIIGNNADMLFSASVNQSLSGEAVINLQNIILKPGEELIINTIDMTVTLNGQNAMQYFTNESEFFNLLAGLNTLIYSDSNASRTILFDVIWKDRWL